MSVVQDRPGATNTKSPQSSGCPGSLAQHGKKHNTTRIAALTEVYLEHRRALEMEERGGGRARVEAVEVQAVNEVSASADRGFDAVARWTVRGMVTHFGHRHFRENRYEASVTVVPIDDHWRIRAIDVLNEERVQ